MGGILDSIQEQLAGRRVLVIEDEALVTMLLEDTLAEIGCEVVGTASRYREAAEKASSLEFDIAVLDVNLDGDQTLPIAEALLQRGKCFVFATGYGAASLPNQFSRIPTLQKPFQQRDLERALRVALNLRGVDSQSCSPSLLRDRRDQ